MTNTKTKLMLAMNHDDMIKQMRASEGRNIHTTLEQPHYQDVINDAFNTIVNSLENLQYLIGYFRGDTQFYIETMYGYTAKDCIFLSKEKQELLTELDCIFDDMMKVIYKSEDNKINNTNK
jgi:hypothetical protein